MKIVDIILQKVVKLFENEIPEQQWKFIISYTNILFT